MRVKAKPVEIDVWPWTGKRSDLPDAEWDTGFYQMLPTGDLVIQTTEGPAVAIVDFHAVAVGTEGERYPMRMSVLRRKYELADVPTHLAAIP